MNLHPEATCERCGRPNISWHAPSPVWNAVLRGPDGDEWSVICPVCFAELAEAKGISATWHLGPEPFPDVPLGNADGLVWDAAQCLWVAFRVVA